MTDYTKIAVKSSSLILLASFYVMLMGYILRIFLSRSLTVEEFGLFYAVVAFVAVFNSFRELGLNSSLVKHLPEFLVKKDYTKIKSSILFVSLTQIVTLSVITIVIFSLSDTIAIAFFKTSEASLVLKLIMLSISLGMFYALFQSIFQGFQKMKYVASMEPFRITFVTVGSVLFITLGLGIIGVALSYVLAVVIGSFIFFYLFTRIFPKFFEIRSFISKKLSKKLALFGAPIFIGGIALYITEYASTIILTAFRSLEEVGFYQIALPTSQLLLVFTSPFIIVLFPMVSELYARKKRNYIENGIGFSILLSFSFLIPFLIIIFTSPEIIIGFLFSNNYLPAALPLQILSIGMVFYALYTIFQVCLNGIGKSFINMKIIFIIAAINLVSNLLLIPVYGIVGAAIASLATYIAAFVLAFGFLRKYLKINIQWIRMVKIFIGSIITILLIFYIKGMLVMDIWPELAITLSAGFGFYISYLIISKTVTKSDVYFFERFGLPVPKNILRLATKLLRE